MSDAWSGDLNAEMYDRWARAFPMYRESSSFLADFASVKPGDRVVDLCCGTGVTTEELLRRVGAHGHVWSVDASPEMLAMARRHIDARNVAFVCWPAESFHIPVEGPADALLCNSAFWQTDAHQTLSSARTVLRDGGLLVFNLPADRVKLDSEQKVDRMFRHSRLQQRMSEIATREYAYTPRSMQSFTPTRPLDADGWKKLLAEHGFELEALELTPNPTSAQSHVEWLKVPVFSTRLLPGLPYALRIEILERAIEEVGLDEDDSPRHWVNLRSIALDSAGN